MNKAFTQENDLRKGYLFHFLAEKSGSNNRDVI